LARFKLPTYPAFSKRDAVEVGKLKMTGPGAAHIALSDSEQFRVRSGPSGEYAARRRNVQKRLGTKSG